MPTPESAPHNERRTPRRFVFSVHGNPMARASDRTEAAVITLLVVIWVLCLPVAAAGGSKLWDEIAGTDRPQQRAYSATAELLAPTEFEHLSADGTPLGGTSSVQARWSGANGVEETGQIQAAAALTDGTRVQIWLDRSGVMTTAPVSSTTAAAQAVIVATVGWVGLGILLAYCASLGGWGARSSGSFAAGSTRHGSPTGYLNGDRSARSGLPIDAALIVRLPWARRITIGPVEASAIDR
jgi:hypothetical protein